MTAKLFWENPYQTSNDTVINTASAEQVTVAETVFFACSGGQESDYGTIAGVSVLEAVKDGHDIIYTLPAGHGLQVEDRVTIAIDWERRYRLMQLHFAAELVLELTYRQRPGITKIGAHISPAKARLDFLYEENISPLLPELRAAAESLIQQNLDIVSAFSDPAAEQRYWEVDGFARVPCGGTHLRKTGEIGDIVLKRNNIGKGKERIEIYLQT